MFVFCVCWRVERVYLFKQLFCAEYSGHLYIIMWAKFQPDPSRQGLSSFLRWEDGNSESYSVSLADMDIMTPCKTFHDKLVIISESQIESL